MKLEIELIMFDLDGTLADTGQDLAAAVNHVRERFRLGPLDRRLIEGYVGRGVEHLLSRSLPAELAGRSPEALELFLNYYERHMLDATRLFPRVRETLEHFCRKRRVVVSNKPRRLTVGLLVGLGLGGAFDAVFGGDSSARKKPDPGPLLEVLGAFSVSARRALMVGDGAIDVEAGKGAGVHTCGVAYGLGKVEELRQANPDLLIDDLWQLTEHFV